MRNFLRKEGFRIGVLALQGAFAPHLRMLSKLGVEGYEVRTPAQLASCTALIIPGGESTTMSILLQERGLHEALLSFAHEKPVFGTCAGLILLVQAKLLDLTLHRNAYGPQRYSFTAPLEITLNNTVQTISALFIRAPQISALLSNKVKVLSSCNGSPVLVQQGHLLASSFHPELTDNSAIHAFFLDILNKKSGTGTYALS